MPPPDKQTYLVTGANKGTKFPGDLYTMSLRFFIQALV